MLTGNNHQSNSNKMSIKTDSDIVAIPLSPIPAHRFNFLIVHSCQFLEQITFYMNLWMMIFIINRFHRAHRYGEIKAQ